jgi:hypothetical protein
MLCRPANQFPHSCSTVKGYNGQPVGHPLLTEIRQHHLLISQTLARLKVDIPEDAGVLGVSGFNKARAAANKRWRGA